MAAARSEVKALVTVSMFQHVVPSPAPGEEIKKKNYSNSEVHKLMQISEWTPRVIGDFFQGKYELDDASISTPYDYTHFSVLRQTLALSLLSPDEQKAAYFSHPVKAALAACELPLLCQEDPELKKWQNKVNKNYLMYYFADGFKSLINGKVLTEESKVTEEMFSTQLTYQQFVTCFRETHWKDSLKEQYLKELFVLFTVDSKNKEIDLTKIADKKIDLFKYFFLLGWLGDPSLSSRQTMPVGKAINFYYQLLRLKPIFLELFDSNMFRVDWDQLNPKMQKGIKACTRLNYPKMVCNKDAIIVYHRGAVFTEYDAKVQHSPMFEYCDDKIKEASDSYKTRYVRRVTGKIRTTNPHQKDYLDFDFHPILGLFNSVISENNEIETDASVNFINEFVAIGALQRAMTELDPKLPVPEKEDDSLENAFETFGF